MPINCAYIALAIKKCPSVFGCVPSGLYVALIPVPELARNGADTFTHEPNGKVEVNSMFMLELSKELFGGIKQMKRFVPTVYPVRLDINV